MKYIKNLNIFRSKNINNNHLYDILLINIYKTNKHTSYSPIKYNIDLHSYNDINLI